MKLHINDEAREIEGAGNVAELITALGLPVPSVLVEHNGMALRRNEWDDTALADGDRLEIIRIVAGG